VRDDGTVSLPLSDPIMVAGLSLAEATEQIRHAYTVDSRILPEGKNYVSVTLMQPRESQVVVIRAEAAGAGDAAGRPSGAVVNLPAYENDVLHALSATGGLPGPDARNEIVIFRGGFQDAVGRDLLLSQLGPDCDPCRAGLIAGDVAAIRIPLRYHAGQVPMFTEQDIILQSGDVVMIAARDHDRFYTDGAIPGGEHILPRDRDLDVLQAIALAGGSDCDRCDVGCPACEGRTAIVVRKVPCGGQIPIRVDLERALTDPRERILIQPDDLIIVR
jgi:protein involved in polysaccharide export with SLBB domain